MAKVKTVAELVDCALLTAATKPKANWTAKTANGLFNTKEENHEAAIKECTKSGAELLKREGKGGVLTAAGFARIAVQLEPDVARRVFEELLPVLPETGVGAAALAACARLPVADRIPFIQDVLRRTPLASPELEQPLREAIAEEARAAAERLAKEKVRQAQEAAALAAIERVKALFAERRKQRLEALRAEYAVLGGDASELKIEEKRPDAKQPVPNPPEPKTHEERDFRRYECDRLAAAWREAWDAGKTEGRDYLETAMWNIRGFKMIGEVGQRVAFDGRYHESEAALFTDHSVLVARPGWLLKTDDEEYIALKALVSDATGG